MIPDEWVEAAAAVGLTASQGMMTGRWNDTPVRLDERLVLSADIFPPNNIGLLLDPPTTFRDSRAPPVMKVHARLDGAVTVRARDVQAARALLTPTVVSSLLALSCDADVRGSDAVVGIQYMKRMPSRGALYGYLDQLVHLARLLRCPGAEHSWRAVAARYGLDAARDWTLSGYMGSTPVRVRVRRTGFQLEPAYETIVETELDPVVPRNLTVMSDRAPGIPGFLKGGDLKVGVPDFDSTFLVHGSPEAEVMALLPGEPARRLVALGAIADDVRLEAGVLSAVVSRALTIETDLDLLLTATVIAAEAFDPRPRRGSPYR